VPSNSFRRHSCPARARFLEPPSNTMSPPLFP
jgi:hypothetical protein